MIGDDRLNCGDFLLGSHTGTFNFLFSVRNHEWNEISQLGAIFTGSRYSQLYVRAFESCR
jgi:hypothetical protein